MPTFKLMRIGPPSLSAAALASAVIASGLAGCATERLGATAPAGVNLTGEWNFNPNLSDDPGNPGDPDRTPQRSPGGHRGHGGGRGGGAMPPLGSPGSGIYDFRPAALTASEIDTSTAPPAPAAPAGRPRGASSAHVPVHLSITQQAATILIKTNMSDGTQTSDEYTAGTSATIPFGHEGTAERAVGWRGPVFVVSLTPKKGGWREDDFALDDDGRLIMTTAMKNGRTGSTEIKRVYDRARGAEF